MKRSISWSEIQTLACTAAWDFRYGGHLTGGTALKRKQATSRMREGRAWGAAAAAFHAHHGTRTAAYAHALDALRHTLRQDAAEHHDPAAQDDLETQLADILWHYVTLTEPLALHAPEFELRLPLPSRTGRRNSTVYEFEGYVDGLVRDGHGLWIAEFKLRDHLSSFEQVTDSRQTRFYAWAAQTVLDEPVVGVIVEERRNELPKPPRILKSGKPSHAKDQLCTPDAYLEACDAAGEDANADTLEALSARRWQERHRVFYSPAELEEAGSELVAAAQLVAMLDSGRLRPFRNPSVLRCGGCAFRGAVCRDPHDRELIDIDYDRAAPKRLRGLEEAAA